MNGYLLDTNVISEYSRDAGSYSGVANWIRTTPESLQHISVLTLAEIETGILRKQDGRRRRALQRWFDEDLQMRFAGRILPFDKPTASRWARLVAACLDIGRRLPAIDSQIAATALVHDLALVTRNVKDFADLGLTLINPWEQRQKGASGSSAEDAAEQSQ